MLNTWKNLHLRLCLAAIGLMLTVPFLMAHHYNPIPSFFQEWTTFALGFIALSALLTRSPSETLSIPEIAILPLALLFLAALQLALQADALTGRVLLFGCYLVWSAALIVLGRYLVQTLGLERLTKFMARAVLIGACLAAGSGLMQLLGLAKLPWFFPFTGGGLKGNLAQNNNFADYLWLGLASALYLRARGALSLATTSGALLFIVPIAVLSGSRSIWLYCISLVALSFAWARRHAEPSAADLRRWSCLVLLGTILSQLILSADLLGGLLANIATAGGRVASQGSYDSNRLTLWRIALDILFEYPMSGAGIGQFTQQFHLHVLEAQSWRVGSLPEHSHNLLLQLLAEMGLPAGALLLFFGCRWLLALARMPRHPELWWIAAVILILGIHSGLEYPLWYAFFLGIAAISAGAGSQAEVRIPANRLPQLGTAILLVIGTWILHGAFRDYSLLENSLNGRLPAYAASDTTDQKTDLLQRLSGSLLLRHHIELVQAHALAENGEGLQAKLQLCDKAQRFSATQVTVFKCALFMHFAGDTTGARLALRRAVAAYPNRATLVLADWKRRSANEPIIASLIADFVP